MKIYRSRAPENSKNNKKSHVISAVECRSFFSRIKGQTSYNKAEPLFFRTRFGIHTFGMMFPIDVIILNVSMKIVRLKINLIPGKFLFWNFNYPYVLEMPEGSIERLKMELGDTISLNISEIL